MKIYHIRIPARNKASDLKEVKLKPKPRYQAVNPSEPPEPVLGKSRKAKVYDAKIESPTPTDILLRALGLKQKGKP
jgi:hypothetical protein